jgi:hypothetical protein
MRNTVSNYCINHLHDLVTYYYHSRQVEMVGRQGCRQGAVVEDRGLAQGREQEQDEGSNSCQYGHNIFFRTKVYLDLHV